MKSQAKILFCLTQGLWGGAQKYVLDLAFGLGESFDVHIAIGHDEAEAFAKRIKNAPVHIELHILKHLRREIMPYHDILSVFEMKRLYKQLKPDIVHLNSSKAGVIGSLAKIPSSKIVYTAHGWVFLEPLGKIRQGLYRFFEKYTARFKDTIIVLSPEEQAIAEQVLRISKEKLEQIPLGIQKIEILDSPSARNQLVQIQPALNPQKFWFGTIANSYATKGLDILIQSVAGLPESLQGQAQWIIIGDGPEKTKMQLLVQKLQLEEFVFLLPFLPEASHYLSAFDTFVLPSRKEGFPYTLLEALQVGIPIIATQVGGVPSLIQNKETGLLVPPEDIVALQDALRFSNEHKDLMEHMAQSGKKSTETYTLQKMIEKTTHVYTK